MTMVKIMPSHNDKPDKKNYTCEQNLEVEPVLAKLVFRFEFY